MEKDKKEWEGKEWSKEDWEAAMDAKKQKDSAADESGQGNEAIMRARAHKGRPLKCLCLHGGDMNGASFEAMITNLKEAYGPLVEFVFAQAPHAQAPERHLWMGNADKQGPDAVGWWDDSLAYLQGRPLTLAADFETSLHCCHGP